MNIYRNLLYLLITYKKVIALYKPTSSISYFLKIAQDTKQVYNLVVHPRYILYTIKCRTKAESSLIDKYTKIVVLGSII